MKISDKVYKLCRKIPKGKITTYGAIANKLNIKCYQAIGQILKRNPDPINTPCYKVIKSDGTLGGYSGPNPKKLKDKISLLKKDGIEIKNKKINLQDFEHKF